MGFPKWQVQEILTLLWLTVLLSLGKIELFSSQTPGFYSQIHCAVWGYEVK